MTGLSGGSPAGRSEGESLGTFVSKKELIKTVNLMEKIHLDRKGRICNIEYMILRDLSVTTPRKSKFVFGHNGIINGITELYLFCLGKFYSGQFFKVIVEVGGSGDRSPDKMVDVIRIYEQFDFEKYTAEDISGKRKMVIDVLQSGLLAISTAEGWDSNRLIDAYECCLSRNLEFKYIFKEKYWRAPNRLAYAAIYCFYEVEQF